MEGTFVTVVDAFGRRIDYTLMSLLWFSSSANERHCAFF